MRQHSITHILARTFGRLWKILLRMPSPASRVDLAGAMAPPDLVDSTRAVWSDDHRVRFDDRPAMRIDRDGLWIVGWVLAGSRPIDREDLRRAVDRLPLIRREVYLLYHRDGMDHGAIAARLGIGRDEVRRIHAEALLALDQALAGR